MRTPACLRANGVLGLVAFLGALALSTAANAQAEPGVPYFDGLRFFGNACPPGSLIVEFAADGSAMTVIFSRFVASAEGTPGQPQYDRKSCDVIFTVHPPVGRSFAIEAVDYRGFLALEAGAMAVETNSVLMPPLVNPEPVATVRYEEPFWGDYLRRVPAAGGALLWSPCDALSFGVRFSSSLTARARSGSRVLVTIDSIDGTYRETYRLAWRQCR